MCSNYCHNGVVASCRPFDFTLSFEFYVLSVVPTALFIVIGLAGIPFVLRSPQAIPSWSKASVRARLLYLSKGGASIAFVAANLASLVSWASSFAGSPSAGGSTASGTIAVVLSFVASLVVLALS